MTFSSTPPPGFNGATKDLPDAPPQTDIPAPTHATACRVFLTSAIDLSDFLDISQDSLSSLQQLRSNGGLGPILMELQDKDGFAPQSVQIREDGQRAKQMGGKQVWADTFLDARASWVVPCLKDFEWDRQCVRQNRDLAEVNGALAGWTLDNGVQMISPDGVVVFTASFRLEVATPVDSLVSGIKFLKEGSDAYFRQASAELLKEGGVVRELLGSIGFAPGTGINPEKVRSHRTTFVHSLTDSDGRAYQPHDTRSSHSVAGLLNLAEWYPEYHGRYLRLLGKKEFGYKHSELFLSDRGATIAVQEEFWEAGSPLRYYMGDILLAVEYHLGIQALLRGQLQYARRLYSAADMGERSAIDAAGGVKQLRAILSGAYESLNYSVLVLHGFTRRILGSLDTESEISLLLADVERRVENVTEAVSLEASVQQTSAGIQINQKVLWVTMVAAFCGLASLIVAGVTLYETIPGSH